MLKPFWRRKAIVGRWKSTGLELHSAVFAPRRMFRFPPNQD
jgi:hypothetical protein